LNLIDDIREHWAGKGTLSRAYWGYGVVGTLILYVLAILLALGLVPFALEDGDVAGLLGSPLIQAYLVGVSVVVGAYHLFAAVIIWRNSNNVRNRTWGDVARVIVVLGVLALVYQVATQF
jgi:hypothetical protein